MTKFGRFPVPLRLCHNVIAWSIATKQSTGIRRDCWIFPCLRLPSFLPVGFFGGMLEQESSFHIFWIPTGVYHAEDGMGMTEGEVRMMMEGLLRFHSQWRPSSGLIEEREGYQNSRDLLI